MFAGAVTASVTDQGSPGASNLNLLQSLSSNVLPSLSSGEKDNGRSLLVLSKDAITSRFRLVCLPQASSMCVSARSDNTPSKHVKTFNTIFPCVILEPSM